MGAQNGLAAVAPNEANPQNIDIDRLQAEHIALSVQHQLLTTWVATVKMASGNLTIKALLQQVLEITQALTGAEQGSVFSINANGSVGESLLARGSTIREQKREIVSQILGEGLAAWTIERRQVGLITDTMTDSRWLTLPNQPYTVRSALCVPLLRGKRLLGLVTLMHGEPERFDRVCAERMALVGESIALVLENAQIYAEQQLAIAPLMAASEASWLPSNLDATVAAIENNGKPASEPSRPESQPGYSGPGSPNTSSNNSNTGAFAMTGIRSDKSSGDKSSSDRSSGDTLQIDRCGLYIATAEAKLRYINRQFARIFGYRRREVAKLGSLLDLILPDYQDYLRRQIDRCMRELERPMSCVVPGRHQDGHLLTVEIYAERIHFSGQPGTIGLVRLMGERSISTGNIADDSIP